jgi:hypothetical protein
MYLSSRAAFIRNLSVSVLNGAITLIILLIAPMGLAGVIMNTALVTLASFANATLCDRIVHFLQPSNINITAFPQDSSSSLDQPHQK